MRVYVRLPASYQALQWQYILQRVYPFVNRRNISSLTENNILGFHALTRHFYSARSQYDVNFKELQQIVCMPNN